MALLFSTMFTKFVTEDVNPKRKAACVSSAAKIKAVTAGQTLAAGDFAKINTIGSGVPGSGITLKTPASPSAGDTVYFFDAGQNLENKPAIINGNGKNIMGKSQTLTLDVNGANIALTYVDAQVGWEVTGSANDASAAIVLESPDGTLFVLAVANDGTLTASELT